MPKKKMDKLEILEAQIHRHLPMRNNTEFFIFLGWAVVVSALLISVQ